MNRVFGAISLLRAASLLAAMLLCGCAGFSESMDKTWETIDPMGHRKKRQEKNEVRPGTTGMRLPDDDFWLSRPPLPGTSMTR